MTGGIIPKPFDSIIPVEKIKYFPSKQKATNSYYCMTMK